MPGHRKYKKNIVLDCDRNLNNNCIISHSVIWTCMHA